MTTTNTIPLSLLEAVNELLQAVGRAPVSSLLTSSMDESAQDALAMISNTSIEVQSRGWHFNHEEDYPFNPFTDGTISLPTNTGAVTVGRRSAAMNVTQRGSKLYDLDNHTYVFKNSVYLNITFIFEFQDIPPPIRWYVMALAGRKYGVGKVPDNATYKFTSDVEKDALSDAEHFNQEAKGPGLNQHSPHFANNARR